MTLKEEMIEIRKKLAECEDRKKKLSDKAKKILKIFKNLIKRKLLQEKLLMRFRIKLKSLEGLQFMSI